MKNHDQTTPLNSPALDEDNDTVAIPRPANELEETPADDDKAANGEN